MPLILKSGGAAEQTFVLKHLGKGLSSNSCTCKAYHAEAKHYYTQNGYIPKWKKTEPVGSVEKLVCNHPHCSTTSTEVKLIVLSFEYPEKN